MAKTDVEFELKQKTTTESDEKDTKTQLTWTPTNLTLKDKIKLVTVSSQEISDLLQEMDTIGDEITISFGKTNKQSKIMDEISENVPDSEPEAVLEKTASGEIVMRKKKPKKSKKAKQ